jgi:hypothetical protein
VQTACFNRCPCPVHGHRPGRRAALNSKGVLRHGPRDPSRRTGGQVAPSHARTEPDVRLRPVTHRTANGGATPAVTARGLPAGRTAPFRSCRATGGLSVPDRGECSVSSGACQQQACDHGPCCSSIKLRRYTPAFSRQLALTLWNMVRAAGINALRVIHTTENLPKTKSKWREQGSTKFVRDCINVFANREEKKTRSAGPVGGRRCLPFGRKGDKARPI